MQAVDLYLKTLYNKYRYIANWLPNAPIMLGDIGYIEHNQFKKEKSLKDLGIAFKTLKSTEQIDLSLHYKSQIDYHTGVNVDVNIPGEIRPVNANARINFEEEGAFTFDAIRCTTTSILNKGEVGEEIKKLYRADGNKWRKDWYVIDSMIRAESATIILSSTNNSHIELGASAKTPTFNLADAKAEIKVTSQNGEITKIIAQEAIVPLFNASRLKNNFFGGLIRSKNDLRFGGEINVSLAEFDEATVNYPFWEKFEA